MLNAIVMIFGNISIFVSWKFLSKHKEFVLEYCFCKMAKIQPKKSMQ
jgi:hypothetical protein